MSWKRVIVASIAALGCTASARAQGERDSVCYYMDAPRTTHKFALTNGYTVELTRASDSTYVEDACSVIVRNARNAMVWKREGFGTSLAAWTGRDIDNDGYAEAILGVDTGGGNKCCWGYTILRLAPKFEIMSTLDFTPFFDRDERGHTLIRQVVPFYDLGPDMAESPIVTFVHQFRNGKLQDITLEQCPKILSDTARRVGSLVWDLEEITPQKLADAKRAVDATFEVQLTRSAVSTVALQYLVCARPNEAAKWIGDAWPSQQVAPKLDALRNALALRMPKSVKQ